MALPPIQLTLLLLVGSGGCAPDGHGLPPDEHLKGAVEEVVESTTVAGRLEVVTITYDDSGRPVEGVIRNDSELVERSLHQYFEGRPLETRIVTADGEVSRRVRYLYDEEGRLAEVISEDRFGVLERKVIRQVKSGGREAVTYGGSGELLREERWEPQPEGGWLLTIRDPKAAGLGVGVQREIFDPDGRVVRTETLDPKGEPIGAGLRRYREDEQGNWIERVDLRCPPLPSPDPEDCETVATAHREIHYRSGTPEPGPGPGRSP